ncbi:MAG TPA: tryptophan--tRNA ligase [Pyrinomonadaceae bacterium]|nr:tryptophan--tRNA ligase [Pyrinomonadaceae bacterium]
MKKRIFSGAQPTGELHIGNYLGALKNWVALQDEYEAFYCIVNLHAITLPQDPAKLRQKTLDLARVYLAAGVDPSRSTIFIQSDVAEHAELTWVLSCVARMGELGRMTQFKEKRQKSFGRGQSNQKDVEYYRSFVRQIEEAQGIKFPASDDRFDGVLGRYLSRIKKESMEKMLAGGDIPQSEFFDAFRTAIAELEEENEQQASVGLFTYPVLMAADILLYQTDLVPVGQDQKQHLELSRDLAIRFNRDFGKTFKVPEPYIPKAGASIKSLQDPTKKMSKSDENPKGSIFLTDDADTITKKIKSAVTDSGTDINFDETRPAINNLLTIYQLVSGKTAEDCVAHFEGKMYGQFKGELAEAVVESLRPFQQRIADYDDVSLRQILDRGAEKARSIAAETLTDVYQKTGIR